MSYRPLSRYLRNPVLILSLLTILQGIFPSPSLGRTPQQMGVTQLRETALSHISKGAYQEGIPVFEELVRRFQFAQDDDRQLLEGVYLFLGLGYMQEYGSTRNPGSLDRALETFEQYEANFPNGSRRHLLYLFRADCFRGLGKWEAAATSLITALSEPLSFNLKARQRQEALEKLVQSLYILKDWDRGIPWFQRLLASNKPDQQTLAAAALTEAYIATAQFDRISSLLPFLTGDAPARYDVRFNLKLLEGGDKLTEEERFLEASLLYYLTLTRDELLDYWQRRMSRLKGRMERLKINTVGGAADEIAEIEIDLLNANNQVKALGDIPSYTPELEWRKARNFKDTARNWEAYWAFWRLAEDYPDREEQIEDFYYAAFVQADLINEIPKAEQIANLYLDREDWLRYRREISVTFAGLLLRSRQYERLIRFATAYIARDPADSFNPQLIYYLGSTYIRLERYDDMVDQLSAYIDQHPDTAMMDGCYYWSGLGMLFTEDYDEAVSRFSTVISDFPRSPYFEDSQFRIGVAYFANDRLPDAEAVFSDFIERYPESILRGEGELFLGDIASADARVGKAIRHYDNVSLHTDEISFINHATFQKVKLLEANQRYAEMERVLRKYQETYGEDGKLTVAIFEQGRAFELMGHPEKMLEAYLQAIIRYGNNPRSFGLDKIIFAYPEKYEHYKTQYEATIRFITDFVTRAPFREGLMRDRRLLYDFFNEQPHIEADLKDKLLRDKEFRAAVMEDLSVLTNIRDRVQARLNALPVQNPEQIFTQVYDQAVDEEANTLALRMNMALEHLGTILNPTQIFSEEDIRQASPQTLVWIARRLESYDNLSLRPLIQEALDRVVEVYPQAEDALLEALMALGDLSARQANLDRALSFYQRVQSQFPTNPRAVQAVLRQGDSLMEAGRYDQAVKKYEIVLKTRSWRGPAWAEAQYKIGLCHFKQELFSEAHAYFERTFLAFSQYRQWAARAYLKDAETLLRMGAREDARNTLREVLNTPGYEDLEVFAEIKELHQSIL